jgi:hypothetical protein
MRRTVEHRANCDLQFAHRQFDRTGEPCIVANCHFCEEGDLSGPFCTCDYEKRRKVSEARKAVSEAYASCGMVRVRGSLGGTYWE